MLDLIASLPTEQRTAVLIVGCVFSTAVLIAVPAVLGYYHTRLERDRRAGELAADLLAAGFGAAEIRDALAVAFPAPDAREETVRRALLMGQSPKKVRELLDAARAA